MFAKITPEPFYIEENLLIPTRSEGKATENKKFLFARKLVYENIGEAYVQFGKKTYQIDMFFKDVKFTIEGKHGYKESRIRETRENIQEITAFSAKIVNESIGKHSGIFWKGICYATINALAMHDFSKGVVILRPYNEAFIVKTESGKTVFSLSDDNFVDIIERTRLLRCLKPGNEGMNAIPVREITIELEGLPSRHELMSVLRKLKSAEETLSLNFLNFSSYLETKIKTLTG